MTGKDSTMPGTSTPGLIGYVIAALTSGGGATYLTYIAGRRRQARVDKLTEEKQKADLAQAARTGEREDLRLALEGMKETLKGHQFMIEQNSGKITALEARVHELEKEKSDLIHQLQDVELLKATEKNRADGLQTRLTEVERDLAVAQAKLRKERKEQE